MDRTPKISPEPKVTILMGVYNGAAYLPAQLESIARQTHQNWHLICSDDGSTDISFSILSGFACQHPGKVTIRNGPQKGFAANFLSLIAALPRTPGNICFADQDDIWLPEKISFALNMLRRSDNQIGLYCGRQYIWFPGRDRKVSSRRLYRSFTLRNALVENVATGNTILLNPAAAELARRAAQRPVDIFAHDWWLYLLVTATGGRVIFDNSAPQILYRQHEANLIGAGTGLINQFRRKTSVFKGAFSDRVTTNLNALDGVRDLLSKDACALCSQFRAARASHFLSRLIQLKKIAPYRQTRRDTLSFWGAASLGFI